MQITISGHHVDVTPALKDYVITKFDKLERHSDSIVSIQVTLSVEKLIQKSDAIVRLAGGELFANSENEDLYAAVDLLIDKLDRQLLRHKEKILDRKQGNNQREKQG